MDGATGGRCQACYAMREYHHKSTDPQDYRSASYAVRDGDSASYTSSQVKKVEVTEMQIYTCADGMRPHATRPL